MCKPKKETCKCVSPNRSLLFPCQPLHSGFIVNKMDNLVLPVHNVCFCFAVNSLLVRKLLENPLEVTLLVIVGTLVCFH